MGLDALCVAVHVRSAGAGERIADSAHSFLHGASAARSKPRKTVDAMNPQDVTQTALAPAAHGVPFIELFLQASPTVQFVMTGPGLASIWSWAIIIEKLIAFRRAASRPTASSRRSGREQSLDELYNGLSRGPTITMAALFVAAMREWKRSVEGNIRALGGIQLRVEKVMDVTISREMERLDRRLLFLATVGSTAPFVGLFGTVWGIMQSFQAIAISKNTSLAVVAPGIAEAAACDRARADGRYSGGGFLQQVFRGFGPDRAAARGVRRRVRRNRFAPDRREELTARWE